MKTQVLFGLDASQFSGRLAEYAQSMPDAAENAVNEALVQLRSDAETIQPTVPLDMGDLRQDVELEVNRQSDGSVEGQIAYTQPYATRMHEQEYGHYSEPGSGPKYVETKLTTRVAEYHKIMADTIKDETGAG